MTVLRVFILCFLLVGLTWTSSGMSIGSETDAGNENLRAKRDVEAALVNLAEKHKNIVPMVMGVLAEDQTVRDNIAVNPKLQGAAVDAKNHLEEAIVGIANKEMENFPGAQPKPGSASAPASDASAPASGASAPASGASAPASGASAPASGASATGASGASAPA